MKKQKSGLYRTKMKIGVDQNGRPINIWLSSATQRGLEEEKRMARAKYIDGTGLEDDRLFGAYATEWYRVRKEPYVEPGTRAVYRSMLNKHLLPVLGDRNLRAIRPMDLQRIVNGLGGGCASQIRTAIVILHGVFGSALQDRLISSDPTTGLQRPKSAPAEEKRALTPAERQRVESVALTHPQGLLLALLYWLGVRSGEARGFRWGDVDWAHGRIHVQRSLNRVTGEAGPPKTAGSDRWIPIDPRLMEMLRERRGLPGAYILTGGAPGQPMAAHTAARLWPELRDAAGLPGEMTQHWLRHNFATMCRDAGLRAEDTMYLLGHTSYQTTLGVYTHMTERRLDGLNDSYREIFTESCTKVAQTGGDGPEKPTV